MNWWTSGLDWDGACDLGEMETTFPTSNDASCSSYSSVWCTGRDALVAALRWMACHPAGGTVADVVTHETERRVWIPTFYCSQVVSKLEEYDIRIERYADHPQQTQLDLRDLPLHPGDVLLVANYFGVRPMPKWMESIPAQVRTIEDHTHDPMHPRARRSHADFAFASLRKSLPIPDGAVLWSLTGEGPESRLFRSERASAVLKRLSAMLLLQEDNPGPSWPSRLQRDWVAESEDAIARGPLSGASPLSQSTIASFPYTRWFAAKRRNVAALQSQVKTSPGVHLVTPPDEQCTPVGLVGTFLDSAFRDRVRARLHAQHIDTTIGWESDPGGQPSMQEALRVGQRLLVLPCDARDTNEELDGIAFRWNEAVAAG